MNVRRRQTLFTVLYALFSIVLLWSIRNTLSARTVRAVSYTELIQLAQDGKISEAEIRTGELVARLKPKEGEKPGPINVVVAQRLPGIDDKDLVDTLAKSGAKLTGKIDRPSLLTEMLISFTPLLLLGAIYWFGYRKMSKGAGPLSVGRTKAKIYDANARPEDKVTFADVAGVEEARAELREVVQFLKEPQRYGAIGARIPKGVLLLGSPGTGKTLLARAVAGEANVPFFSLSGSEFVEMFVGVGAARMRDLFEQAKRRAPCIVFIDELDAIGKSRAGVAALATHDEREQTLNQLLVEMDGFAAGTGVVIMAATNRPEVLDQALLRAGRFDRQVVVERPDVDGREAILVVHARKVKLSPQVNLAVVARRTVGMVGADLANVVNEAALAATRRGAKMVEQQDFEEAIDRIQLGLKKHGRAMGEEEKKRVAFHESGHALVALSVSRADPVHRVTIIPRSIGALGATLQLPTEDRYLVTAAELEDRLAVMLGGRTAEELVFGDVSTGASNDLERATETARQMVCRFGMSEALGPLTYGAPHALRFLQGAFGASEERNYSEKTAQAIDAEVRRIVDEQLARAREILTRRRAVLQAIAGELLVKETLEREQLEEIVRRVPAPIDEAQEAPEAPVAAASGTDGIAIGHA